MSVTYVDSLSVAPAAGRTSVSITVPVSPGPAIKDVMVVAIYKENTAAITPPDASWTLKASDTTNATTQGALFVFWKRLTAVDAGPYVFSWTGAIYAGAQIFNARGCVETGDPFRDFTILRTSNNTGNTIAAAVTSVLNGLGLSFISTWAAAGRTFTAPTGWTRAEQHATQATGYKESMADGSTGTITWVASGNDYYQMFLGVLKPPPTGPIVSVIVGGVKKSAVYSVIVGGVKKAAQAYAIVGGVKKQ